MAVAVLLQVAFFGVVTVVGLALVGLALVVGVVVGVPTSGRSTSLCGTATTGGTVAPLLAGVGWGMVIEA